jgi:hypothetical protein
MCFKWKAFLVCSKANLGIFLGFQNKSIHASGQVELTRILQLGTLLRIMLQEV